MARDYYQVLGVSRDADADELQQAYRRLARANHPDVNRDPGAEERFKEVNDAYHVLSDPELRKRYDRFGEDFRQVPDDWEERVGAGTGRSGPWSSGRGRPDVGGGYSDIDLDAVFGDLFGGRGRGRSGAVPGSDQEAELPLTLEEAYRGGRKQITLNGPDGPRSYTVTIPAGVTDGKRIRLGGEGGRAIGQARPGDLYLVVRLQSDPRFRVEGKDIVVQLPLAPWEAALGATVPVPTPGGEAKVTVPAGSSTGRRLRVRGEGMPNPRGRPGDLHAEVAILVPPRLTRRERELFSELASTSRFDPRHAGSRHDAGGHR